MGVGGVGGVCLERNDLYRCQTPAHFAQLHVNWGCGKGKKKHYSIASILTTAFFFGGVGAFGPGFLNKDDNVKRCGFWKGELSALSEHICFPG